MISRQSALTVAAPPPETLRQRLSRFMRERHHLIGPTVFRPEVAPPSKADEVARLRRENEVGRAHSKTVTDEVAALDRHAGDLHRRIEAIGSTSSSSFALQEMIAEARQLRELRVMLLADGTAGPIRRDRDGREITDRDRAIVAGRSAELRESMWAAAARADGEGDRRRARQLRRDALRSRQIAEYESRWRESLPGYGMCAWT